MYRQLVEASSCVDRSLREFDRCIRGVRALALAWQGLGAAGEVPILDLQGFIELLVNHLMELTDGMRRGTHPMLWTMEMLREARVKVMAWAGENPNLPPLDAVGLTMFSLGEKAQRALAARRMQAQIGLGLGFIAPNGGRGNGAERRGVHAGAGAVGRVLLSRGVERGGPRRSARWSAQVQRIFPRPPRRRRRPSRLLHKRPACPRVHRRLRRRMPWRHPSTS
jgi:hypothetical protein